MQKREHYKGGNHTRQKLSHDDQCPRLAKVSLQRDTWQIQIHDEKE